MQTTHKFSVTSELLPNNERTLEILKQREEQQIKQAEQEEARERELVRRKKDHERKKMNEANANIRK